MSISLLASSRQHLIVQGLRRSVQIQTHLIPSTSNFCLLLRKGQELKLCSWEARESISPLACFITPNWRRHAIRDHIRKLKSVKPTRVSDVQLPQQHLPSPEGTGFSKAGKPREQQNIYQSPTSLADLWGNRAAGCEKPIVFRRVLRSWTHLTVAPT